MTKWRLFSVRFLCALLIAPQLCYGLATDSAMQKMLSGMINNKLTARGVSSSSAAYANTFTSVGSSIVGSAAGAAVVTAVAAATAPAWLTVGATIALGAVFSAAIGLGVDAAVKWAVGPDGTTKITKNSVPPAALVKGGNYWVTNNTPSVYAADGWSAIQAYFSKSTWGTIVSDNAVYRIVGPFTRSSDGLLYGNVVVYYNSGGDSIKDTISASYVAAASPESCPAGSAYSSGTKSCFVVPLQPQPAVQKTIQQAVDSLTAQELQQPVDPLVLVKLANAAWKSASAQSGYQGVPFDEADPITEAEAQALRQANPDAWPKVEELVKPQPVTTANPSPFTVSKPDVVTNPGTDAGTNPGTNPGTTPTTPTTAIDWGSFAPPSLEATPTMQSIMDPLLNLWPEWSAFSFPAHQSTCPTPSFTLPQGIVGGHTIHFVEMCDFLEANNVRQLLQAAFAVAWAIAIAFVVMGA